jgi:hypothetical protein
MLRRASRPGRQPLPGAIEPSLLLPLVEDGATLAEFVNHLHRCLFADGEGILSAVVTCPRCGGDYRCIVGDPGYTDLGGYTEEEVHRGTCD